MAAAPDRIALDIEGPLAIVRLSRADKHNAVDLPMIAALIDTARRLRRNRDLRAVILTGDGPSFCAGIDIKSLTSGGPLQLARAFLPLFKPAANRYQKVSLIWRTLSVPVIAALHGNCFGAGLQIALGADLRLAHPGTRLSVMEAKWGLIPDMGGMVLMRELLARDVAFELTTTARVLTADQARDLGLVTRVEADPLAAARALADEIASRSPDAAAAAKHLFRAGWEASDRALLSAERRWQRRMLLGANQRIAVARNQGQSSVPFRPRQW